MSPDSHAQRREDLEWMAKTGENGIGAAERLGIKYAALEKWAHNHAPELWAVMVPRNPRDWNGRTGGKNQWTAA